MKKVIGYIFYIILAVLTLMVVSTIAGSMDNAGLIA